MQPYGHSPWQPSPYGAPPPPPPPPRPPSRAWIAITAIIVIVVFAAGGMSVLAMVLIHRSHASALGTYGTAGTSTSPGWSDAASPVPVTDRDPIWGDREAPVTMVVFGDFQDPFCARLAPTVDSLKSLYGPSQLRVVWKHHPLAYHVNARDAAIAAEGVRALKGSDAFFHFQERAFANQTALSAARYEDWAVESGVVLRDFQDGIRVHTWDAKIDDDVRLATTLGVIGSPVSYVNGIKVSGAVPVSSLQKTIDDEMVKARAAIASGVAGDRIYITRSTDNIAAAALAPSATTTYAPPTSPLTVYRVPVGASPVLGKRDAFVTIVEFADFQCPFCNRAESTLATLRTRYGDDLRIVWKNEPLAFHPRALPAAELAVEARIERGDAVFWKVHDAIYAAQSTGLDETTLLGIARANGVSETSAKSAMTTAKYQSIIDADHVLAKKVGVSGTPAFFINGRSLSGAQPVTTFATLIDEEMIKAKDRVAKGTARTKVYDEIISTGIENP